MEQLQQFCSDAHDFFNRMFAIGEADFWGAMFSWALIGILGFISLKLYQGTLLSFITLRRQMVVIPRALRSYQKELERVSLTIRHSWKLEGQDFKNLLVPVHFDRLQTGSRVSIDSFLARTFVEPGTQRFVLIGEPGSGKSVALGSIARQVWFLMRKPLLVPVLLTFSEVKQVSSTEEMEAAIAKSLQRYQFEKGKRTKYSVRFVHQKLVSGQILVLLDGFDELEKTARQQTARFVEGYFSTYPQIPFVISCRTAVWKDSPGVFSTLSPEVISMARFNNNDIRQFLSGWQFQGNKSSEQLGELIRKKPYLQSIAENPLMLTIIAYLYAQPKRVLPDNRVKFYEDCVDALMEEFDNTKQIERANEFQTNDKVSILSHIAYQQIVDSQTTDTEIRKEMVLETVKTVMDKLSRPTEKRQKMLTEIIQNTELLVDLPPDHYKFPHRTFMEYFAANYFLEENKAEELLKLYDSDPGKWQETLALFCGMNLQEAVAKKCLDSLERQFDASKASNKPNVFVFRALVESAKVRPEWALSLLAKAEAFLETKFNYDLVEYLGYIGTNTNLIYAAEATKILTAKLGLRFLSSGQITALLLALSANRESHTSDMVAKYIDRLDSNHLYDLLRHDVRSVSLVFERFNQDKLKQFIKAAEENNDIEILLSILKHAVGEEIKITSAESLAMISKNKVFFDTLSESGDFKLSTSAEEGTCELFKDWSWEKYRPFSDSGKKLLALIVHYLVMSCERGGSFAERVFYDKSSIVNGLLEYQFRSALNNAKLITKYSKVAVINIPIKKLKLRWESRRLVPFFSYLTLLCFLIIFFISSVWQYDNSYGKVLAAMSIAGWAIFITSLSIHFIKRTEVELDGSWGMLMLFLITHYSFIFNKNKFFCILALFLGVCNIACVLYAALPFYWAIIYIASYSFLQMSINLVQSCLLYPIILPSSLVDLLEEKNV